MPKIDSNFLASLKPAKRLRKNLTGQTFGQLTVIECLGMNALGHAYWKCQCACGKLTASRSGTLLQGNSESCGCGKRYNGRTHGKTNTPEFRAWQSVFQRCNNPRDAAYPRYGGRGITICEGWQAFETFLADMGKRPIKQSLDRKNNDEGYWCGHCAECVAQRHSANCRWATSKEQNQNRRDNYPITAFGKTQVLSEWAQETGRSPDCIKRRIKAGMSVEDALTLRPVSGRPLLKRASQLSTPAFESSEAS